MEYDKTLTSSDGEEFPYYSSSNNNEYHYGISVVWDERDGELVVMNEGVHLSFDDDNSWLRFPIQPSKLFPNQASLTKQDLIQLLQFLPEVTDQATLHTEKEIKEDYQKYLAYISKQKL